MFFVMPAKALNAGYVPGNYLDSNPRARREAIPAQNARTDRIMYKRAAL
jgi:hypothetical protein